MTTQTEQRSTSAGGIVLTVVGAITVLVALAALVGGGIVLWANHTQRDADGYFATAPHTFQSGSYAIAHEGATLDDIPNAIDTGNIAHVRIKAVSGDKVFVGIARERDVNRYLANVAHSKVTDVEGRPFEITYAQVPGSAQPQPPREQRFWAASSTGSHATLDWPVEEGDWSVVVMNADGSAGVHAKLTLGAKIAYLGWIAAGLALTGALLLVIGALMMVFGVRRFGRRAPKAPAGDLATA